MLFGAVRSSSACPNCALGREARALVLNNDFIFNVGGALAPFLVILAISAAAEKLMDSPDDVRSKAPGPAVSPKSAEPSS